MAPDSLPLYEFVPGRIKLRIDVSMSAEVESISPVVAGILAMAAQMQCASGKELEVETALREALANAITHGCNCDPNQVIHCSVACDEQHGILIIVRDPGNGYDPLGIPSPLVGENIFSNHGRGIFLINQLMDEVHIRRNGAEIVMRKR
ncbi:MAG TPA: ATP-binding protein [Terriglobales bacterium]|jgi:serine/threonine-protein kinase RsbW|nr:ATP-binding protein [Terriglobales bacterium]